MNPDSVQKIQKLINVSPILSAPEKAEWLVLLELMDDKQIGELEKILASDKKQEASDKNVISQSFAKPAFMPVKPQEPAPQQHMPQLSHIMNLPRVGMADNKNTGVLEAKSMSSAVVSHSNAVPAANGGFAAKLKNIFTEKELTAGKPNTELELGSGQGTTQKNISPKTISNPEHPPISNTAAAPKVPAPTFSKPAVELKSIPTGFGMVSANPVSQLPKVLNIAADKGFSSIKERLHTETETVAPTILSKSPEKNLLLENLASLTQLNVQTLRQYSLEELVKPIKPLRSKYGYFDVIFNLEQSPLYQSYIATGLKVLSSEVSFDELAEQSGGNNFLGKEDFEKFTDLLVKIQGS